MQAKKILTWGATFLFASALFAAHAQQTTRPRDSTADAQAKMPTPAVEPPPKPFKTAEEHYQYLLEKAHEHSALRSEAEERRVAGWRS